MNQENKKRYNPLTIVLFVFLLVAVGVIGYLIGSNSVKDNNVKENKVEENNKVVEEKINIEPVNYSPKCNNVSAQEKTLMSDIDSSKYDSIFEYIEEQKNVTVLINYHKGDLNVQNGVVSGVYELTEEEKNIVFNEMKNSKIEIATAGIGGAYISSLEIKYERNNKEYFVSFWGFFAMSSDDGNIYKIIDESINNTLEDSQNCLYSFDNLSSTAKSITKGLSEN